MTPACEKLYVVFGTLPNGEPVESWACGMPESARALFQEHYRTATPRGLAVYQLVSVAEGTIQLSSTVPPASAFPIQVEYLDTGECLIVGDPSLVADARPFRVLRTNVIVENTVL